MRQVSVFVSRHPTRWPLRVSFPPNLEGFVTKFAPYKALKLMVCGKLTFDERVVLRRVDGGGSSAGSSGVYFQREPWTIKVNPEP